MSRDLTSGSVLKSVVFFSLPYLLAYFLQTLYGMADLFIIGQFGTVAEADSSSQRQSSYAYVDGDYRGFSDGCDGDDRPLCRSAQFSQSGARDRQYGDVIRGAFTGFGRRAAFEQSSYSRFDCDSDGGG